jgi:hypothetical protein
MEIDYRDAKDVVTEKQKEEAENIRDIAMRRFPTNFVGSSVSGGYIFIGVIGEVQFTDIEEFHHAIAKPHKDMMMFEGNIAVKLKE